MSGFDINGDGLIDMRIDATAQGIGALRGNAETLKGDLTGAFAEIDDLTGKLGKGGKMSDQFMADYKKWRAGTDDDPGLDKGVRGVPGNDHERGVPGNYHKIADTGDKAVGEYRTAEQNASNGFRR